MDNISQNTSSDASPAPDLDANGPLPFLSVKQIAYMSVFIALSAVGAMIKIPSPVGTIGLDSGPGYFCGLAFGYVQGSCVIFIGHLLTAGLIGFPLGIPLHLFIGLQLAVWVLLFRWVSRRIGMIAGAVVAILMNGVVSAFTMFFVGGMGAVLSTMPFLLVGSLINIAIAVLSYKTVRAGHLV